MSASAHGASPLVRVRVRVRIRAWARVRPRLGVRVNLAIPSST